MTANDSKTDPKLHLRELIVNVMEEALIEDTFSDIADAIIAELGLRLAPGPPGKHRYVTEWKADK